MYASRRAQFSWCFFDWANSAFPTVIVTFVFAAYFAKGVAANPTEGTTLWGTALSLSGSLGRSSPTVEAHFDSLRVLHVCWNPEYNTSERQLREMRKSLRRRQGPKWKDSTSPLLIVRPLVAPVSEPIEAGSDVGALFELLKATGCRMPEGAS